MFRILILLLVSFSVKAQDVYKTPSGAKYHLANCRMVKNVSEKITLVEAAKLGLESCKICAPVFVAGAIPKPKTTQVQSGTVQSNSLTKAGNRCRHITGIDNRYCYQHFFSATSRPLPDVAYINFNEPKRNVPVGRRCCEVKITLAEAAKLGLAPCKICASSFITGAIQKPKTTKGQRGTVQGNGLTKAGNRCRHITGIDKRYCYQHFFSATSRPLPDLAYINFNEPKRNVPFGRHCCEVRHCLKITQILVIHFPKM